MAFTRVSREASGQFTSSSGQREMGEHQVHRDKGHENEVCGYSQLLLFIQACVPVCKPTMHVAIPSTVRLQPAFIFPFLTLFHFHIAHKGGAILF